MCIQINNDTQQNSYRSLRNLSMKPSQLLMFRYTLHHLRNRSQALPRQTCRDEINDVSGCGDVRSRGGCHLTVLSNHFV